MSTFRFLLVIFFGSLTLIGRAQNDFFQFDTNFPSRTLFPFVDGTVFNIKDLVDDVRSFLFSRHFGNYFFSPLIFHHPLKLY